MCDITDYPVELRGGYYDGAKLIGTREEGRVAEYYNPSSHGIVEYAYDPDNSQLSANYDPERPLPEYQTIREYVERAERVKGSYESLSDWAEGLISIAE